MTNGYKVMFLGVYLADVPNVAADISKSILDSKFHHVDCSWASIGRQSTDDSFLGSLTRYNYSGKVSKNIIINRLLRDHEISRYDYIVISDDDILLPDRFLDRYLEVVSLREYAISQPARTHSSFVDHYFVSQLLGVESRMTNFVEIGPLYCVSKQAFSIVFPLDEDAPMGWGLDFIWPVKCASQGLKMGIVDSLPVEHSLRKPVSHYVYETTEQGMRDFLQSNEHLAYEQSFHTLESYPLTNL